MFHNELLALVSHLRKTFTGKQFDYNATVIEAIFWLKAAIDQSAYPVQNLTQIWVNIILGDYELGYSPKNGYTVFNCSTGEILHG